MMSDPYQFQTYSPPTCAHGRAWADSCAACCRPYVPPAATVIDLSTVLVALGRIEALLSQLVAQLGRGDA